MPCCPSCSKRPAKRQHLQRLPTRLQSEITAGQHLSSAQYIIFSRHDYWLGLTRYPYATSQSGPHLRLRSSARRNTVVPSVSTSPTLSFSRTSHGLPESIRLCHISFQLVALSAQNLNSLNFFLSLIHVAASLTTPQPNHGGLDWAQGLQGLQPRLHRR